MKYVIVKDGTEDMIRHAVTYVESLGIPRGQIRRVTVDTEVGQALTIGLEIFVPVAEKISAPDREHEERLDEMAGYRPIDHAFRSLNGDDKCAAIVGPYDGKTGCGQPQSAHMSHYVAGDPHGPHPHDGARCLDCPECVRPEHGRSHPSAY